MSGGIHDIPSLIEAQRNAMWRKLLDGSSAAKLHRAGRPRLRRVMAVSSGVSDQTEGTS